MTGGPFTSLYEARGCQTADEHATAVEQAAGHAKDSGVAHQNLCETKIFGRLKQAAAKMLSGRFGLKVQELRDPATLITAVTRQERLERFRPPRRKEHLTQLVAAYCLSLLMENLDDGAGLQWRLAISCGLKGTKAQDRFRVAAETCFDYGGADRREKDQGRVARSRDVGALRHLRSLNIWPYQIPLLARRPGEGVNSWYRAWTAVKSTKPRRRAVLVTTHSDASCYQLQLPLDQVVAASADSVDSDSTRGGTVSTEHRSAHRLTPSGATEPLSPMTDLSPTYVLRLVREQNRSDERVLHVEFLPGNLSERALEAVRRGMADLCNEASKAGTGKSARSRAVA